jgi:hypothetical protein
MWINQNSTILCDLENGEDIDCSYQVLDKNVGDHSKYHGGMHDCKASFGSRCTPKCVNGYCKDNKCVCSENWSGESCAIYNDLCEPKCVYGKCLRNNKCICNHGFGGKGCNKMCVGDCYSRCKNCLEVKNTNKFCADKNYVKFECGVNCQGDYFIDNFNDCEKFCCNS